MRKIKVNAIKGRNLTTGEEFDVGLLGQKLPITFAFNVSGNINQAWGSIFYDPHDYTIDASKVAGYKGVQVTYDADKGRGAWVCLNYIDGNTVNVQFVRPTATEFSGKLYVTFFFE